MTLFHPIQLGSLSLPNNIIYAPLAGCSDYAYRKTASLFRPGLVFCEMVKMDALVRSDPTTFSMLNYAHDMHPIGAQLCGSNITYATQAARIIEDMGFDVVDLNCGCPVDKVTKDGGGSSLLKTPDVIGELLHTLCSAVSIPVTVKIRAGWDDNSLVFSQLTTIAEAAGAKAITIHGRTRQQAYSGKANRAWIAEAKTTAKSILVFGNGDIFSPDDAIDMISQTSCDGILIARGTFGRPWIAEDIIRQANGQSYQRSVAEQHATFLYHFHAILASRSDAYCILDMRRVGSWYTNAIPLWKPFRSAFQEAQSVDELAEIIARLPHD